MDKKWAAILSVACFVLVYYTLDLVFSTDVGFNILWWHVPVQPFILWRIFNFPFSLGLAVVVYLLLSRGER